MSFWVVRPVVGGRYGTFKSKKKATAFFNIKRLLTEDIRLEKIISKPRKRG